MTWWIEYIAQSLAWFIIWLVVGLSINWATHERRDIR